MNIESTTSNPGGKPDLAKTAQVTGVLIAIGYLFLVLLMAVRRDELPQAGPILSIAVLAMIGGIASVVVGSVTRGAMRSYALSGIGLLLLILTLMLSQKATLSSGLRVLYGGESGLLAFGFAVAVFVLGCLLARGVRPESALVRMTLGISAGVALMLYLVHLLVALAEGGVRRSVYGEIFSSGDPVMIIYTVLVMLAVLTIFGLALIAVSGAQDAGKLGRAATRVALGVLYLVVGLTFLRFFLAVFQDGASIGRQVLDLATELMAGLLPFLAIVLLCVRAIRESLETLGGIEWTALKVETKAPAPVSAPSAPPSAKPQQEVQEDTTATAEEQLKKLKRLREQELITEAEYQQKRADILSRL